MIGELFLAMAVARVRPVVAPLEKHLRPTSEQAASAGNVPRITEMFGLPGSGKTTLIAALGQADRLLKRTELTAAWRRLSWLQQAGFLVGALVDVRCLGGAARFAFHARLTSADSIVRLIRLVAKAPWMRSRRGEMLLDESFLQEIWSICLSAGRNDPNHAALAGFIRCLYAGLEPQIIFVQTSMADAAQRINGRSHGHSRLDGLTVAEVEVRLVRTARLTHAIIAAAVAAGLPVERLDGSDPVEANAARLRHLLMAKSTGPSNARSSQ